MTISIRKSLFSYILLGVTLCATSSCTQAPKQESVAVQAAPAITVPAISEDAVNFYVVNDLGRNGYYEQQPIAELLGDLAEEIDIEFVAALGDTHHFDGVTSVNDPLWMTNYELIYKHPELMIDWFAILGNHEYRGNTQSVLDYSNVSRRWNAPARYYSRTVEAGENQKALLVFIDTTPLIDKYHKESDSYPDASKQSIDAQLQWLDKTLADSDAKWKIVMGHHPVYADTKKSDKERKDMQARVEPLLNKHAVDMYVCGHIHSFQHIRPEGSNVDYVVNSSGSLARKVNKIDGTQFCSSDAGFSIVSMEDNKLSLIMMNGEGKEIYRFSRER